MKETHRLLRADGIDHTLVTDDGYEVAVDDYFYPILTEDVKLDANYVVSRHDFWVINISCMSGCPLHCRFCPTGEMEKWRSLTAREIFDQVRFVLNLHRGTWNPRNSKKFQINYSRMGEPFLNIEAVKESIQMIDRYLPNMEVQYLISTIGIKGSDFSWIDDRTNLNISLHSLDEAKRDMLIPYDNKMSLKELGQIRIPSKTNPTLKIQLIDPLDFRSNDLGKYFDPRYFSGKIYPLNPHTYIDYIDKTTT